MFSTKRHTPTKQLSLELHQSWNVPSKHVHTIVKITERGILQVCMIMRASKRLWVRLKINKLWMHVTNKPWIHVTVILDIYECGGEICPSRYKCACTASDSVKELSMSLMEEFSKYKLDFEDFWNCATDF